MSETRTYNTIGGNTIDVPPTKYCTRCRTDKPKSAFAKATKSNDKLQWWCTECITVYLLMRNYGITPERFNELLEYQGGTCAICPATLDLNDKKLSVDHIHEFYPDGKPVMGKDVKIRGLLCGPHNRGIGSLDDLPLRLYLAFKYLIDPPYPHLAAESPYVPPSATLTNQQMLFDMERILMEQIVSLNDSNVEVHSVE